MGRILDALLGRNFKTSRVKIRAKLAISRIAILKNQRQVRCAQAKSDVIQLLKLGRQESALLRAEHLIKDQNMMDAFAIIEDYCHLLVERVTLLQKNKECPDELKEAISSLIFASSRCGELPELQEIRGIFASRFGKEFAARAVELRNSCGVNPKIIRKLSAQQPSLESRMKALKDIAAVNGISLDLEENSPAVDKENSDISKEQKQKWKEPPKSSNLNDGEPQDEINYLHEFKLRENCETHQPRQYTDVVAAAQDAYESAAYAAAAARAAVKLSRSEFHGKDQGRFDGHSHRRGTLYNPDANSTPPILTYGYGTLQEMKQSDNRLAFDKNYTIKNMKSESHCPDIAGNNGRMHLRELKGSKQITGVDRTRSTSNADFGGNIMYVRKLSDSLFQVESLGNEAAFYATEPQIFPSIMCHDLEFYGKLDLPDNECQEIRDYNSVPEEESSGEEGNKNSCKSPDRIQLKSHFDDRAKSMGRKSNFKTTYMAKDAAESPLQKPHVDGQHLSLRTRRG